MRPTAGARFRGSLGRSRPHVRDRRSNGACSTRIFDAGRKKVTLPHFHQPARSALRSGASRLALFGSRPLCHAFARDRSRWPLDLYAARGRLPTRTGDEAPIASTGSLSEGADSWHIRFAYIRGRPAAELAPGILDRWLDSVRKIRFALPDVSLR